MTIRLRRLKNDYDELRQYAADQDRVLIRNAIGEPPEKYQIEYRIKGLELKGGEVVERSSHLVEIVLPLEYPTVEPKCRMLTPVFHPNISPQVICHTDHWAAGESLVDVVVRIGEMISYQNYNVKSPRNGEAARWAESHMDRFPVDPVGLSRVSRAPGQPPEGSDEGLPRRSEDPVLTKTEATDAEADGQALLCANCGAKGAAASFHECSGHHRVCPDCALSCDGCGKQLCVLCSFSLCASCKAVLCDECAAFCSSCRAATCHHCGHVCPSCRRFLCPAHFLQADGPCVDCLGSDKRTDAPADPDRSGREGREEAARETPAAMGPTVPCSKCGKVNEYWNAGFCPFCGAKLE